VVNWNWVFRWLIIGPPIRSIIRIHLVGAENLPKDGPFIIAAGPHRTEIESVVLATALRRWQLRFFAKQEYWEKSWLHKLFMNLSGQIPLKRKGSKLVLEQIDTGVNLLGEGEIVALYPEGTRNKLFQKRTYKARSGVAHIALRSQVPVYPVGMIGMEKLLPKRLKKGVRPGIVTVIVGEPIVPQAIPSFEDHPMLAKAALRLAAPLLADQIGRKIAALSITEYHNEELPIEA
jgi:1-acyl-sn-glycerol-3-phosphate acyltransferase